MGDKETFSQRVQELKLDVNTYERIEVYLPSGTHIIPNAPGKQGSLQVYAAIAGEKGYITPKDAARGLEIFGQELRDEAHDTEKHPNITILEDLISSGQSVRAEVVRRKK